MASAIARRAPKSARLIEEEARVGISHICANYTCAYVQIAKLLMPI